MPLSSCVSSQCCGAGTWVLYLGRTVRNKQLKSFYGSGSGSSRFLYPAWNFSIFVMNYIKKRNTGNKPTVQYGLVIVLPTVSSKKRRRSAPQHCLSNSACNGKYGRVNFSYETHSTSLITRWWHGRARPRIAAWLTRPGRSRQRRGSAPSGRERWRACVAPRPSLAWRSSPTSCCSACSTLTLAAVGPQVTKNWKHFLCCHFFL